MEYLRSDALIVGGGLEGCLLALQLQRAGQKVILVHPGPPPALDLPYDLWAGSPFTHSAWEWSHGLQSRKSWEALNCLRWTKGAALAPRESQACLDLLRRQEELSIVARPLRQEEFPELRLANSLATFGLDSLPWLLTEGLPTRLWGMLHQAGVQVEAQTALHRVDWEHEHPTVVGQGVVFRGRRLFLMGTTQVERFLNQPLPALKQVRSWLQAPPELDEKGSVERPCLWIHYAKAPCYWIPRGENWGWGRLAELQDAPNEEKFLLSLPERWLHCRLGKPAVYRLEVAGLEDGRPCLEPHPWREDCLWMAGVGQTHWLWLPSLLATLIDPAQGLPEELRLRRFQTSAPQASALLLDPARDLTVGI